MSREFSRVLAADSGSDIEMLSPSDSRLWIGPNSRISRQIGFLAIPVLMLGAPLMALINLRSIQSVPESDAHTSRGVPVIDKAMDVFACQGQAASLNPGTGDGTTWKCNGGACIAHSSRCNGRGECFDGSDESGCPTSAPASSSSDQLSGVQYGTSAPVSSSFDQVSGVQADTGVAQVIGVGVDPPTASLQDVLAESNYYRCLHGAQPLQWDGALAENAQNWADQTAGAMTHSSLASRTNIGNYMNVGENLAKGAVDASAVTMWYNEIQSTPGGQGQVEQFGMSTGHYTQLVWASTKAVGCGTYGDLLVCQYGPSGNYNGAFQQEVHPLAQPPPSCAQPTLKVPPTVATGGTQIGNVQVQSSGFQFTIGIPGIWTYTFR